MKKIQIILAVIAVLSSVVFFYVYISNPQQPSTNTRFSQLVSPGPSPTPSCNGVFITRFSQPVCCPLGNTACFSGPGMNDECCEPQYPMFIHDGGKCDCCTGTVCGVPGSQDCCIGSQSCINGTCQIPGLTPTPSPSPSSSPSLSPNPSPSSSPSPSPSPSPSSSHSPNISPSPGQSSSNQNQSQNQFSSGTNSSGGSNQNQNNSQQAQNSQTPNPANQTPSIAGQTPSSSPLPGVQPSPSPNLALIIQNHANFVYFAQTVFNSVFASFLNSFTDTIVNYCYFNRFQEQTCETDLCPSVDNFCIDAGVAGETGATGEPGDIAIQAPKIPTNNRIRFNDDLIPSDIRINPLRQITCEITVTKRDLADNFVKKCFESKGVKNSTSVQRTSHVSELMRPSLSIKTEISKLEAMPKRNSAQECRLTYLKGLQKSQENFSKFYESAVSDFKNGKTPYSGSIIHTDDKRNSEPIKTGSLDYDKEMSDDDNYVFTWVIPANELDVSSGSLACAVSNNCSNLTNKSGSKKVDLQGMTMPKTPSDSDNKKIDPKDLDTARAEAETTYDWLVIYEKSKDPKDLEKAKESARNSSDWAKIYYYSQNPKDLEKARQLAETWQDWLDVYFQSRDPKDLDEIRKHAESENASCYDWTVIYSYTKDLNDLEKAIQLAKDKRDWLYYLLQSVKPGNPQFKKILEKAREFAKTAEEWWHIYYNSWDEKDFKKASEVRAAEKAAKNNQSQNSGSIQSQVADSVNKIQSACVPPASSGFSPNTPSSKTPSPDCQVTKEIQDEIDKTDTSKTEVGDLAFEKTSYTDSTFGTQGVRAKCTLRLSGYEIAKFYVSDLTLAKYLFVYLNIDDARDVIKAYDSNYNNLNDMQKKELNRAKCIVKWSDEITTATKAETRTFSANMYNADRNDEKVLRNDFKLAYLSKYNSSSGDYYYFRWNGTISKGNLIEDSLYCKTNAGNFKSNSQ